MREVKVLERPRRRGQRTLRGRERKRRRKGSGLREVREAQHPKYAKKHPDVGHHLHVASISTHHLQSDCNSALHIVYVNVQTQ